MPQPVAGGRSERQNDTQQQKVKTRLESKVANTRMYLVTLRITTTLMKTRFLKNWMLRVGKFGIASRTGYSAAGDPTFHLRRRLVCWLGVAHAEGTASLEWVRTKHGYGRQAAVDEVRASHQDG